MARIASNQPIRGRLTSSQISEFKQDPKELSAEASAENAPISVLYGRNSVPGRLGGGGTNGSGDLIVRRFWGYGEIHSVEDIYINGEPMPADVQVNTYRGTLYQGVDPFMVEIHPAYDDDMIITTPEGRVGVAYSVFKIPASVSIGSPRIEAVIKGRHVHDPRRVTTTGPFQSHTAYDLRFAGTDGTTPTSGIDVAQNALSIAWGGGATIQGNQADIPGLSDYVEIANSINTQFGAEHFTHEFKFTPDSVSAGLHSIVSKVNSSPNFGMTLGRNGADLVFYASSNGTSWDIANGDTVGTITVSTEINIAIEFNGYEYLIAVDDEILLRVSTTDAIDAATGAAFRLGQSDSGQDAATGTYRCVRLTKGVYRYGSPQPNTGNTPYTDSGYERVGYIYDDVTALIWRDLATDPIIGLGVESVGGEIEAINWNEEDVGGEDRSRICLVLSGVKPTHAYLDLIANYGGFFWFPDDAGVSLLLDKKVTADAPSGWQMGVNGSLLNDASGWTLGTGMTYLGTPFNGIVVFVASAASGASQAMQKPFESGATYVATMDISLISAGSARLELDGTPVIDYQSSAGRYTYEFEATGSEDGQTLQVWKDASFTGVIAEISLRRKYWADNNVIPGSLSIQGLSETDTPTRATVHYTKEVPNSPDWTETSQAIELPGVDSGDMPLIETTYPMKGIYRDTEAANKANAKVLRMQNRARVSWKTTDFGVAMQKGTVVEVLDSEYGLTVTAIVENVESYEQGRYKVTGTRYDESHYPDEITASASSGQFHPGMILPLQGSNVPSGWDVYSDADDTFIKLSNGTVDAGTTGGTATSPGFSGTTSNDGAHSSPGTTPMRVRQVAAQGGGSSLTEYLDDTSEQAGHNHDFDTGTLTPDLFRRENVLIIKTGSPVSTIPEQCMVFGRPDINIENLVRTVAYQNRLLMAASSSQNDGQGSQPITFTSDSADDSHDHHATTTVTGVHTPGFSEFIQVPATGGGSHAHDYVLTLNRNPKRVKLAMYAGTGDFETANGMIVFWEGPASPAEEPFTGWYLCNGNNGTPNIHERIPQIAPYGSEFQELGDNTLSINGRGEAVGHKHNDGTGTIESFVARDIYHDNEVFHDHTIDKSTSWEPPYTVLYALMYNGD